MPRIGHTLRDYCPESESDSTSCDSDDNKNEGDKIKNLCDSPVKKPKKNPCVNRQDISTPPLVNISQNSASTDDSEVPRILRCIVDGKVKKFKKDSRTWLHKSSAKCKTKPKTTSFTSHPSVFYFGPGNGGEGSSGIDNDSTKMELDNDVDKEIHNEMLSPHPSTGLVLLSEESMTRPETDMSCKCSLTSLIPESGSKISQLADSDADISYSEVSECNGDNDSACSSNTSLEEDVSAMVRRHQLTSSNGMSPLPKQSENGMDISDDAEACSDDLTHKLATAIELEKESFKESVLDYAVNLFGKQLYEKRHHYSNSKNTYRRLRKTTTAGSSSPTGSPALTPDTRQYGEGCSANSRSMELTRGNRQEQLLRLCNQVWQMDGPPSEVTDVEENTNSSGTEWNGSQQDWCAEWVAHVGSMELPDPTGGSSQQLEDCGSTSTRVYHVPTLLESAGRALFTSYMEDQKLADIPGHLLDEQ